VILRAVAGWIALNGVVVMMAPLAEPISWWIRAACFVGGLTLVFVGCGVLFGARKDSLHL
jgi:cytochrome c biogenesis protein CcdA